MDYLGFWFYNKFKIGNKIRFKILVNGFNQLRRRSLRNKKTPAMRVRDKS